MGSSIEKIRALMKRSGDRTELTIDVLCLLASYGLIFVLPQKMNILFWIILGVSAFLFCIGFFRSGHTALSVVDILDFSYRRSSYGDRRHRSHCPFDHRFFFRHKYRGRSITAGRKHCVLSDR